MERKRYPIGIQTFEEIRMNDCLYIDKTEYVYHMANTDGKYFFLSRPRRFGKSLLVSTMQSYFEGKKDLFEGLAIERLEKEWNEYPVLYFDMSLGKHMDAEQLKRFLLFVLKSNEEKYGVDFEAEDANIRFTNLIRCVYEKTKKQVVVLIDEYDAPLLDVVHEDERLSDLRNMMRNFYSPLKGCEKMLRFVFLTGITKFSQLSIFSDLNNMINISMDAPYAGICGITKDELLNQMEADVKLLGQALGLSEEETLSALAANYDGYHFTWPSPDVFNPFSLLTCFLKQKLGYYWFGTGTPTYIIHMMRKFHVRPSQLGKVRAKASSFDAATENMKTLMPLLYQSGYLTIKDYDEDRDVYTLDFPNKEIKVGLFDSLLPGYLDHVADDGRVVVADISMMLKQGHLDEAFGLLNEFMATVPYCDNTHYEGHYQQVFFIIFALLTSYGISVEAHTLKGRVDMVVETDHIIYVLEFKFNKTPQEAMAQINAGHYADAYALKGEKIMKAGVNFSLKNGTNVLEWVIE